MVYLRFRVFEGTFLRLSSIVRILLANLLQNSKSTSSWRSFLSFFVFKEGMLDTPISALGGWPTVSVRFLRVLTRVYVIKGNYLAPKISPILGGSPVRGRCAKSPRQILCRDRMASRARQAGCRRSVVYAIQCSHPVCDEAHCEACWWGNGHLARSRIHRLGCPGPVRRRISPGVFILDYGNGSCVQAQLCRVARDIGSAEPDLGRRIVNTDGSGAEKVVHLAPCSVLVTRPVA